MKLKQNGPSKTQATRKRFRNDLIKQLKENDIQLDADWKDQHLIVNPEVINDLISFANVASSDVVLDIGCGPGTITRELVKRARKVIAVEIDKMFQPILNSLVREYSHIQVIFGDVLRARLPFFNKIVANPPFHILDPMIQRLAREQFEIASLILGERYYRRAVAAPGSTAFTKTSLFTQASFEAEQMKTLDKEDFYPKTRERAVIMKLVSRGKNADPILGSIAKAFSEHGGKTVRFLVNNVLRKFGTPRGKITALNDDQIATPAKLGISSFILAKRLQELSNAEISSLTQSLLRLQIAKTDL